jgi:hypothetical protein
MASRGELDPDAILVKEHSERRVRAGTLRALFSSTAPASPPREEVPIAHVATPRMHTQTLDALIAEISAINTTLQPTAETLAPFDAPSAAPHETPRVPRTPRWLMEGLIAVSAAVLLATAIILSCFMIDWGKLREPHSARATPSHQASAPRR